MTSGTEIELPLPSLLDHQCEPFYNDARFKLAVCGRRWGKTILGLLMVLMGHGNRFGGAIQGGRIWWIAPTFKIGKPIWRDLVLACRPIAKSINKTDHAIELVTGGTIDLKSADDPDSLRGDGLDGVVLDEVADISEEAWKQAIRPALTDKQGWGVLIGTPKGFNWVHELFQSVPQRNDWARWQLPTEQNPTIPEHELRNAFLDLGPAIYEQEFLARFTAMAGSMFPAEWFGDDVFVGEYDWPQTAQFAERVCALDAATGKDIERGKVDYSALTFLGVKDGLFYVDADLMREPIDAVADRCAAWQREYAPEAFAFESNQFQHLLSGPLDAAARDANTFLPLVPVVHGGDRSKTQRIQRLTPLLSRRKMRFRDTPGCRLLVQQLRECPVGDHDDGPDSLEMANYVRLGMVDQIVGAERLVAG